MNAASSVLLMMAMNLAVIVLVRCGEAGICLLDLESLLSLGDESLLSLVDELVRIGDFWLVFPWVLLVP